MSNILRADQNPPFGWYYNWTQVNGDRISKKDIELALKQPKTTQIKWDLAELGAGNRGRLHKVSADVVPDKAMLGAEYALIFTIPDFEDKIWKRLSVNDAKYVTQLHDLFGWCLQGKAAAKWAAVLSKQPAVADRTADTFLDAQKKYLEEVSGIEYLGNVIIRMLPCLNKPAPVIFEEYLI